mmetsp:Transcript_4536/g.7716  ORF Transcript_4536/g.7716 Transcript_4536/m.7716 type:complete len:218 (+) Transcript_4536:2-655(+)
MALSAGTRGVSVQASPAKPRLRSGPSHIPRVVLCHSSSVQGPADVSSLTRRGLISFSVLGTLMLSSFTPPATALPTFASYKEEIARRRRKIPEDQFTLGMEGVKYFDIIEGKGDLIEVGQRIAVHYDVKFRNVTFITSRQGLGVTGGTPVGFNVGTLSGPGSTLPGIDYGVRGMRVGGLRRLLVPPELAYGKAGVGEIPGGATLTIDVELLSIKTIP